MSFKINWEPNGVYVKFSGPATASVALRATVDVQQDPRFDKLSYVIMDCLDTDKTDSSQLGADSAIVAQIIAIRTGGFFINRKVRFALITTDENLKLQVNQSHTGFPLPYPSRVFLTLAEAHEWVTQLNP